MNLFVYCGNNPVNHTDHTGALWEEIGSFLSSVWAKIKNCVKTTFGAELSCTATIDVKKKILLPQLSPITVTTGSKTTQVISKAGSSSKPISVYANHDAQYPIISSSAGMNINIANFIWNMNLAFDNIGVYGLSSHGNTTDSFGIKLNLYDLKIGFEGSTTIQWDRTTETVYTNVSVNAWFLVALYLMYTTGQYVPSPSYAF